MDRLVSGEPIHMGNILDGKSIANLDQEIEYLLNSSGSLLIR